MSQGELLLLLVVVWIVATASGYALGVRDGTWKGEARAAKRQADAIEYVARETAAFHVKLENRPEDEE